MSQSLKEMLPLSKEEIEEMDQLSGIGGTIGAKPPIKFRYSHDAMIDHIIANPRATQGQIAQSLGYTQSWVSIVLSSDAFKAQLTRRRGEIVDPVILASVKERMEALASRSVDVLLEKLSNPSKTISDNLALRAAELGAKSMGLGMVNQAPTRERAEGDLEGLASRLVALQVNVRVGGEKTANERSERASEVTLSHFSSSLEGRSDTGGTTNVEGSPRFSSPLEARAERVSSEVVNLSSEENKSLSGGSNLSPSLPFSPSSASIFWSAQKDLLDLPLERPLS